MDLDLLIELCSTIKRLKEENKTLQRNIEQLLKEKIELRDGKG